MCKRDTCQKEGMYVLACVLGGAPDGWANMAKPPADEEVSVAVPAMIGFVGIGVGALGFGAGYGARSYFTLLEWLQAREM